MKNIEDLLLPSFLDGKRQLTDTFLGLVKNQELDGLGRIEEAVWRKAFYEPYTLGKQFLLVIISTLIIVDGLTNLLLKKK